MSVTAYDRMATALAMSNGKVIELQATIDQLQATIDKLPKTADGVAVVPGMVVYFQDGHCDRIRQARAWNLSTESWSQYGGGQPYYIREDHPGATIVAVTRIRDSAQ